MPTQQQLQNVKIVAWGGFLSCLALVVVPFCIGAGYMAVLVGGIGLCLYLAGWVLRCPACRLWYQRENKGSRLLRAYQERRDVVRQDVTRAKDGREIARTNRIEEVTFNVEERQHYFSCRTCSHGWSQLIKHSSR